MVDILHRVGIQAPADDVFAALTSAERLAGWWTSDTRGDGDVGGVLSFHFDKGDFEMDVLEVDHGKRVLWKVVDGPEEWIGTHISWELRHEDDQTTVLFKHLGWREPVEFMHHCSTKWASYLMSLRSLVETGTGAPNPRDVKIDNWD